MVDKEKIVMNGYNKIAKKYNTTRFIFDNSRELEEFASLLPKNAKVLDIGCGDGVPITKFLVKSGFDVTGVDFSENQLKLARKNVPKATFILKDMTKLEFKNDSFDGLTACYSIIHVPKEKHSSLFQSFHRILKLQGIMLISLGHHEWEGTEEFYGAKMFWSHHSPEVSLQIIKDAGFEIIFSKYISGYEEKHFWVLAKNKQN